MTFELDTNERENDLGYEYDTTEEAIVLIDMPDSWAFNLQYDARCSECDEKIDISNTPTKCPNCDRDFIDVEER